VDNGRSLTERPIDRRNHGRHMRMRGNHDRGTVRLRLVVLSRRHYILRLRICMRIWIVPLGDGLHVRRAMRRDIVLRVVVLGVGIVVYRRVCLRGDPIVIWVLTLAPSLMVRHGWRYHGRTRRGAFTAGAGRDQATDCEGKADC
jgi:hypothetical protein